MSESIDLEIGCMDCGRLLESKMVSRGGTDFYLSVEPCEFCLNAALDRVLGMG